MSSVAAIFLAAAAGVLQRAGRCAIMAVVGSCGHHTQTPRHYVTVDTTRQYIKKGGAHDHHSHERHAISRKGQFAAPITLSPIDNYISRSRESQCKATRPRGL